MLDGNQLPPKKNRHTPQFSAHVYCGQTAVCIRVPLGDIVLDGIPVPPPLRRHIPQFSDHVRCGQTAEWTKMPLDMEVGRGPGDLLLGGNPAPAAPKMDTAPFSAHVYCDHLPISATAELLWVWLWSKWVKIIKMAAAENRRPCTAKLLVWGETWRDDVMSMCTCRQCLDLLHTQQVHNDAWRGYLL